MPRQLTDVTHMSFPPRPPSDPSAVQSGLDLLCNWRAGSTATAIVMAVLLPFAVLWHAADLVAIATSLIVAMPFAIASHLTLRWRLARLAMFPEFAQLPELADTRQRLLRPRNRRRLAGWLRQTAAVTQPPHRYDCCPLLPERVAVVRVELLTLADALENRHEVDPTSVALLHELLADGCSPLYNPNARAEDLHATLTRVRAGISDCRPA